MDGKTVRCIFNFPAETEADLEIKIGDVIHVTKEINSDWYEGQIHNKKGQFPAAFVEDCNDVFDLAVAMRSFSSEHEGDLSFNNGDYIVVTEIVDENWMQGYVQGGGYGLFPRAFVKQISLDPSDIPAITGKPSEVDDVVTDTSAGVDTGNSPDVSVDDSPDVATAEPDMWVNVLENFSAMDSTELDLYAGTKVKVLCDVDDFWCKGVSESGKEGIFPRNFVDLPELVEDKKEEESTEGTTKVDDMKSVGLEPIAETKDEEPENISTTKVGEAENVSTTKVEEAENVSTVTVEESEKKNDNDAIKVIGRTVALFNFSGTEKGDLNFNRGDEVLLLENINENWMKGKINDLIGIFPSNYVEVVEMYPLNETKILEKVIDVPKKTEDNDRSVYENVGPPRTMKVKEDPSNSSKEVVTVDENKLSAGSPIGRPISPRTVSPPDTKKKPPPKPGKPQRPKLPDSKKPIDEASPFSYQFKGKSNPLVIIPSKYRKQGSPNIIILKNWKNEELEEMKKGRGN